MMRLKARLPSPSTLALLPPPARPSGAAGKPRAMPAPPGLGSVGAAYNAVHDWSGLVETSKLRGKPVSGEVLEKAWAAVRSALGGMKVGVPKASLDDVAHIIVAWAWQRSQLLGGPLPGAAITVPRFAPDALRWMEKYGVKMAPGVPSSIRWDLVPWGMPWEFVNLGAFNWLAINQAVASVPALNPNYPPKVTNISDWSTVDFDEQMNGVGAWDYIPWNKIPWALVNWSVVRALGSMWSKKFGASPAYEVYDGTDPALKGKLLGPSQQVVRILNAKWPELPLKKVLEVSDTVAPLYPSQVFTPYLPPKGGYSTTNPVDPEIAQGSGGEQAPPEPPPPAPPPPATVPPANAPPGGRPPGPITLPGTKNPLPGSTEPAGGTTKASDGVPGVVKAGVLLAAGALVVSLLSTPTRRRRSRR